MSSCPLTPGSLDRLVSLGELAIRGVVWLGITVTGFAVLVSGLCCLAWRRGIMRQLATSRAAVGRASVDDEKELDMH